MPTFFGLLKGVCAIYVPLLSHWITLSLVFLEFAPCAHTGALLEYLAQAQGGKKKPGRVPTEETKGRLMLRNKNGCKPAQNIAKNRGNIRHF